MCSIMLQDKALLVFVMDLKYQSSEILLKGNSCTDICVYHFAWEINT